MTPGDIKVAQQALYLSEKIVDQIAPVKGNSALQYVLARMRKTSIDAMVELMTADADNASAIRDLQFKAGMFGRTVEFLREAVQAGDDAAQLLHELDKDELADLVTKDEGASDV